MPSPFATLRVSAHRNDVWRASQNFCSATLQGRAHEAKASHYISKYLCHCEALPLYHCEALPLYHCEARQCRSNPQVKS